MVLWFGIVVAAAATACSGTDERAGYSPETRECTPTRPNGDTPPGEPENPYNHGNGEIWTSFPADGVMDLVRERGDVLGDGSLAFKFGWVRPAEDRLRITGSRLDRADEPVRAHIPPGYDGTFQATAVIFPSPGCWKVTARAGDASLTFVVSVRR